MISKHVKQYLTQEEFEQVEELIHSSLWAPLLKLTEQFVEEAESDVIRCVLTRGESELIYAKCRAEGARKLLDKIKEVKA